MGKQLVILGSSDGLGLGMVHCPYFPYAGFFNVLIGKTNIISIFTNIGMMKKIIISTGNCRIDNHPRFSCFFILYILVGFHENPLTILLANTLQVELMPHYGPRRLLFDLLPSKL